MSETTVRMKSYIQPFEKYLARLELSAILEDNDLVEKESDSGVVEVVFNTTKSIQKIADKLTYWETIKGAEAYYTLQSLRESTVNVARNGISFDELSALLPFSGEVLLPNRRCLRYATHGIHEYKGKYFPQLVRSLLNVAQLKPGSSKILDPMCGSGTTLVEAILENHSATGIDMNPLSVFISKTKCAILNVSASVIEAEYRKLRSSLLSAKPIKNISKLKYFKTLPEKDQKYLLGWFASEVLFDLDQLMVVIHRVKNIDTRNLFLVSLSNIIRRVSWQKVDDLRVRKEVLENVEIDTVKEFLLEAERSVRLTLAFVHQNNGRKIGQHKILQGNSRDVLKQILDENNKFDAIVTSPPYATALPYLDTDRLSLSYLGLLAREDYKDADSHMIGNREISASTRKAMREEYMKSKGTLPSSIVRLIDKIDRLNLNADVGFRRKNLSALLGKYFFDMKKMFALMHLVLKPEGHIFMVVGGNHTIAGGHPIDINTIDLLVDLAQATGFKLSDKIDMEMLVNRNVHKKNATKTESILWLTRLPS